MERELCIMLAGGEANEGDIVRKLLRIPGRVASMSEDMARQLLRLPGAGQIPTEGDGG